MVGLGRMGANIARRRMRAGHACVEWDRDPAAVAAVAAEDATAAVDLGDRLSPAKVAIDGGNAAALKPRGIHCLDIGTSGACWGSNAAMRPA